MNPEEELAELKDAIQRSGMGILRTSQGPSGTMIGYRQEVEAQHFAKELEIINENASLSAKVKQLESALAAVQGWDIYPAKYVGIYDEQSEWMQGWNACAIAAQKRITAALDGTYEHQKDETE